jgi:hypothetical protein
MSAVAAKAAGATTEMPNPDPAGLETSSNQ